MPHPLVDQLRFTRSEWLRALRGVHEKDATTHHGQMNCISWIVGHLAWQEQRYFLARAQGILPVPILDEVAASGGPATTPSLKEMLAAWKTVTSATDPWLALTSADLMSRLPPPGFARTAGDAIRRTTYHYWFHIGEILAIRQLLGHRRLPEYVGDIEHRAPYRPEDDATD